MALIKYIKGDILQSIKPGKIPVILAHSCNTKGSWGGGIAYQIGLKYPKAETIYTNFCQRNKPKDIIGKTFLIRVDDVNWKNGLIIACLFTSINDGGNPDPPKAILENTHSAINDLERQLQQIEEKDTWQVSLPKINAGIFRVPWSETEKILERSKKLDFDVFIV